MSNFEVDTNSSFRAKNQGKCYPGSLHRLYLVEDLHFDFDLFHYLG